MFLRLVVMSFFLLTMVQSRKRPLASDVWNYRDGSDKVNMRGVANLTEILDNWRFDILTQMRNMLTKDHQSLLPDYARISPLSEALGDLFKEFNSLKEHLGDLTEKFNALEVNVDEIKMKLNEISTGRRKKLTVPKRKVLVSKRKPPQQ
ncbi:uncharacterized protein [Narcine bancroftii]|uniref:uncharacterized protein n=1 Tax=Narcine bancroftii TaxID=1343680 RepID=UPI00383136D2